MLNTQVLLNRLVQSHQVPAFAWISNVELAYNTAFSDLADQFGLIDYLDGQTWFDLIGQLPSGGSFLAGQLSKWSSMIPMSNVGTGQYQVSGTFESGIYLILIQSDKLLESTSTDHWLEERSRTVTWELDESGVFTLVSWAVEAVLGYQRNDLIGKLRFDDLMPVEERSLFYKDEFHLGAQKIEFKDVTIRLLKQNGEFIWVVANGVPITDAQGNLLGYRGSFNEVSEKKAAQEALKEQARLLQLVTDNMFDLVVLKDMELRITYVAKAHDSLGYDAQSLIGHSCLELVHPEDVDYLREEINTLVTHLQHELKAEYRVRCADGSYVWLESLGRIIFNEQAKPDGILFSSRDITDRKLAQSELQISNRRFRHLFDNMSQGVVFQDINGKIKAVNPAAEAILGIGAAAMMGLTSDYPEWRTIKEDGSDFPGNEHPAMIALKSGKPVLDVIMGVLNPLEGQHRWILVSAVPDFEPGSDQPYQVFASFTDITKRIQLEKKLQEHERFLNDIIQNSGSMIYVKNKSGAYQVVNKMWEKILDIPESEVLGKTDFEIFPRAIASQCQASDQQVWANSSALTAEEVIVNRKTGEPCNFLTVKFPLFDNQGNITGVCGMCTEITSLKIAEKALLNREAQLNALLESATNGIWAINKKLELTFANHIFINEFEKIIGVKLQIGDQFLHFLSHELQAKILERFLKVFDGEVVKVVEELPTTYGVAFLNTTICPVVNEGEVTGAAVFSINITNEEKARQALAESESRFRGLFDDNASAMYLFNPHTDQFVDVNPAAEHFFGYSRTDFLSLQPSQFIGEQKLEEDKLNRLLNEKSVREERQMKHHSGANLDVEVYSSLIPHDQGWLVCEIIHDISIKNRYFEAMQSQNKILKDIAWTQSHLVRAPLARILGLVELLREGDFFDMSQEQVVQLICNSADELDAIIRDVSEKAYLADKLEPINDIVTNEEQTSYALEPEVILVDDDRIILTMHKGAVVKQGLSENPYLFLNGETAFNHLKEQDEKNKVFIVFLDINMPTMNGWEFLDAVQSVPWNAAIKVVMLTSSVDTADRIRAQQYPQVVSYQNKPVNAGMISELRHHPELKGYWKSSN